MYCSWLVNNGRIGYGLQQLSDSEIRISSQWQDWLKDELDKL